LNTALRTRTTAGAGEFRDL